MRKLFRKLRKPFEYVLNNMRFKYKFFVLYFLCVITPLVLTDSIIVKAVFDQERASLEYDMEYVARMYENYLENMINTDITLADTVNGNKKINNLAEKKFKNGYEYYSEYFDLITDSFLETASGLNRNSIVVYADNDTIIDSEFLKDLSKEYTTKWYTDFIDSKRKDYFAAYYDDTNAKNMITARKIYYIKRLENHPSETAKIVVIGHDASDLQKDFDALHASYPVYVTMNDYVLYASHNHALINTKDVHIGPKQSITKTIDITGNELNIIVVNEKPLISRVIKKNTGILFLLLFITIIIPPIVLKTIEHTIVKRISKLESAFGNENTNTFTAIKDIEGSDEIAFLMRKYNKMVEITNELITTVYKDKIKEQETDIARQKAELLALQSQINPHFMFNALESIRMHSLLKGETETATMVDKLAVMERQNVEWGKDYVSVKTEIESIEAYLALQSYRFGDRLSFDIDVEKECESYLVPKLTIVTFVENACVHGIESKASQGWIFVRVYKGKDELVIEVEDTGEGMSEEKVKEMLDDINNVTIDVIKEKKHVGMLNACLRLKMLTDNAVKFDIESEQGVGLSVIIRIPFNKLKKSLGELN